VATADDWWPLCRVAGFDTEPDPRSADGADPALPSTDDAEPGLPLAEVWACGWPEPDVGLGRARLAFVGELCLVTAPRLWDALEWISGTAPCVDIDLSGVSFIDASGVALLLRLRARLGERQCPMVLRSPSAIVHTVLSALGLRDLLVTDLTGASAAG
jgi:anti-anti-sigma factor